MALEEVTDPELLKKLNSQFSQQNKVGSSSIPSDLEEVTDPQLLQRLNDQVNTQLPQQQKESLGTSAMLAIPRMATDIYKSMYEGAKSIPSYFEKGKSELSGLPTTVYQHPIHLASQGLAGSQELINQLAQLPLNISKYGTERLHLIPQKITDMMQKITPQDTQQSINQLFGQPQYPGESLTRGLVRNAIPEEIGVKALSMANPLNYTNKAIVKDVLKTGEENKKFYNKQYNDLFSEASKQNFDDALNNVNIDMKTLDKYTPERKMVGVTNFDKSPTLENAHKAKSDLLKLQDKLSQKTSLNEGEKAHLNAISKAIDSLKSNMFRDSSGKLNEEFSQRYNNLSKGYAKDVIPYKDKNINKYKRNEISDKKLVEALKNGSFAIKKGSEHPELINQDLMKKALLLSGLGSAGLYGGKMVYNTILGQQNK